MSKEPKKVKLYDGKIEIEFYEKPYHIFKRVGKPGNIISVTGATGMLDKSGPLMGWVAKMMGIYLIDNFDFKKIKSISQFSELVVRAKQEYRIAVKKAADIGKKIHEWAESFIKGENPDIPEDEKIKNGVMAFLKWVKETKVEFINSEEIIYSKKYDYAGILDLEAKIDGKYSIVDFKTSPRVYNEMRYQRAGYQGAKEEMTGRKYEDSFIVRFGKEDGEFEAMRIPKEDQEKDFKAFLGLLMTKRREKELK